MLQTIFVIVDEYDLPIFVSSNKQICHDHINNMLDDDDIFEYAKSLLVREFNLQQNNIEV